MSPTLPCALLALTSVTTVSAQTLAEHTDYYRRSHTPHRVYTTLTGRGDVRHGEYLEYYASGAPMQRGAYRRGERHGTWYTFDRRGQCKRVGEYAGDSLIAERVIPVVDRRGWRFDHSVYAADTALLIVIAHYVAYPREERERGGEADVRIALGFDGSDTLRALSLHPSAPEGFADAIAEAAGRIVAAANGTGLSRRLRREGVESVLCPFRMGLTTSRRE